MATRVGTGESANKETREAAREATVAARERLGGAAASFGFLFVSSKHDLKAALVTAQEIAGVELLGCTTAGEITERGLTREGLAVILVSAPEMHAAAATAIGVKGGWSGAASQLAAPYHAAQPRAREKRMGYSTTITLVDGLCGVGERLVNGIVDATSVAQQVVGGAAGDDGAFKATWVGRGRDAATDTAVALHVFGSKPWGVGIGHGLEAATSRLKVTKAKANVVFEIDGKPAFEAYRTHAQQRGLSLDPKTAGEYMIGNELGILVGNEIARARAPLSVGADGSLACAADVPEGASICILDGKPASMVEAAKNAALEARRNLEGGAPAGVLLFDCICRGMILKTEFQKEIDAVRDVLGDVPVAGFLTYGEIANYRGKLDGWHNTTAVVVAIPA